MILVGCVDGVVDDFGIVSVSVAAVMKICDSSKSYNSYNNAIHLFI
jgi:hypothetical protein